MIPTLSYYKLGGGGPEKSNDLLKIFCKFRTQVVSLSIKNSFQKNQSFYVATFPEGDKRNIRLYLYCIYI